MTLNEVTEQLKSMGYKNISFSNQINYTSRVGDYYPMVKCLSIRVGKYSFLNFIFTPEEVLIGLDLDDRSSDYKHFKDMLSDGAVEYKESTGVATYEGETLNTNDICIEVPNGFSNLNFVFDCSGGGIVGVAFD